MRSFFYISLMVFATLFAHGQDKMHVRQQKKQLDTSAIHDWPTVAGGRISNNGKYAVYFVAPIADQSSEQFYSKQKAVIKSTESNWKLEIESIVENGLIFTEDSRYALYRTVDNELWSLELGAKTLKLSNEVTVFQLATFRNDNYVFYKTSGGDLACRSLSTSKEVRLKQVSGYQFSENNGLISVVTKWAGTTELLQLRLGDKIPRKIGTFKDISSIIADERSGKLCFNDGGQWYVQEANNEELKSINLKVDENFKGLTFTGFERFEAGGKLLIVRFTENKLAPINPAINTLKIFSYQDPEYFTVRHEGERKVASYLAVYDLTTSKLTRLEYPNQHLKTISEDGSKALISQIEGTPSEYYWNRLAEYSGYVLDLISGKKTNAIGKLVYSSRLSPDGQWIIGQDNFFSDILVVSTATGVHANITADLSIPETDDGGRYETPELRGRQLEFFNWTADSRYLIVYDNYDIWLLDPSGTEKPMNLTNGIGRKLRTCFRFISSSPSKYFSIGESVVITAFNDNTKDNGFYRLTIGKPRSLRKLMMGPYLYQSTGRIVYNWQPPVKARDADVWLIPRQRADESPNLFLTKDFKVFKDLSGIYPERKYQWYTSELFGFKTKDGLNCKAVLYKPDNYDPKKKYPVLFNFYQGPFSEKLHEYHAPNWTDSYYFNYTMMLAQGYLVCLTDTRQPADSNVAHGLVDAIDGAADALSKRPYIDSNAFGASAGSYGGFGTNCLAALSTKFKALVPVSGVSNLASMYSAVPGPGVFITENGQIGMGVSLGTDPQRYLRNSPITYSKNVTTPILIINTLSEGNVNVQQGIEWFISLRREGKPAWMLQYQEKGHGISEIVNQKDLYQRMNQFFDHYLKGAPAPVWMTRGISINDRGVKDGFELDTEIKTPEPSKLYQGH